MDPEFRQSKNMDNSEAGGPGWQAAPAVRGQRESMDEDPWTSRSRLFHKTLLFMIVVFGVIATVSSLLTAFLLDSRLTDEYESKAIALAGSLAESDIDKILARDAAMVQARIDQYLHIEGVSYVLVTDNKGEVLAHTFAPKVPQPIVELYTSLTQRKDLALEPHLEIIKVGDSSYIHAAYPILAGVGGWVHIGMDHSRITDYIRSGIYRYQIATLLVFLSSVAVAFLFTRNISKPLIRLAEYAKRVAAHDFNSRIEIRSNDEVGMLSRSMQSMADDLAELFDELEARVEHATNELQETLTYLSAIMNNMANGLLVCDQEGNITRYNPVLLNMFGLSSADIESRTVSKLLGEDFGRLVACQDADSSRGPQRGNREIEVVRSDGELIPVEVTISTVSIGATMSVICIVRDITDRRQAEETTRRTHELLEQKVEERTIELRRANVQLKLEAAERSVVGEALRKAEAKYRAIFENAIEGIYQTTPEGCILSANPALGRIFGYESPDEFIGSVSDIHSQLYVEPKARGKFLEAIERDGEIKDFVSEVRRKDGSIIWVSENARKVVDKNGETLYYEGSLEDITLRKATESELKHQAFHDQLTNLPNRMLFLDHLHMALERSKRRKGYLFAVLYLDLDRFKIINDSLGHDIGDDLLASVAAILQESIRGMDTVARFGGDEFAILLEDIDAPREAVKIARRILKDISTPFHLKGHEVFTSASIGIVLVTEGYERAESILRDADTAMYRAKEHGKSRFKVFNQRMHEEALRTLELETDLRKASDSRELFVYYQPIVDLENETIAGFEALLRWKHSRLGFIGPDEFIPLAEDTGLIFSIGRDVLANACADAIRWGQLIASRYGRDARAPHVSVNISGKQLMQPLLIGEVESILEESGLEPGRLKLEITENVLMEHITLAEGMLARLRRIGIGLSMDDFGTGYSSLSYLRQFPIDTIKIDKDFISAAITDKESEAIVSTVVTLGRSLGLDVIAEGVETPEHLALLRMHGCRYAQGYLFSKPVPPAEAEAMLLEGFASLTV
ncbi:EAL domain-containing protein [Oceanidesulfovibrio marinus]|uniref:EAL domain-containing protein n=1 Tax=Oceanidesulfovibrio marinus TaxID=370038 RepID=A0A6P1ZMG8_9BACT|nr:EAL domain-containing protein [Oceanidesulfovibrio marinus]QJT09088.1 EAL domain-containing protein [Oceanidesulfovibrio marinus]TVM36484.1 sensor domain-containing diguanylate cyclase [Oceanidesulfovibrio marinus]